MLRVCTVYVCSVLLQYNMPLVLARAHIHVHRDVVTQYKACWVFACLDVCVVNRPSQQKAVTEDITVSHLRVYACVFMRVCPFTWSCRL